MSKRNDRRRHEYSRPVHDSVAQRGRNVANGCLLVQLVVFFCFLAFGIVLL